MIKRHSHTQSHRQKVQIQYAESDPNLSSRNPITHSTHTHTTPPTISHFENDELKVLLENTFQKETK